MTKETKERDWHGRLKKGHKFLGGGWIKGKKRGYSLHPWNKTKKGTFKEGHIQPEKIRKKVSKTRIKREVAKGKNNPAYIDGNSIGDGEKYNYKFTKELKTKIRKRDKFICQVCKKKGFSIHHIDYNKLNNKEDNLITLCRRCHGLTGFNRNKWLRYFEK